MLNRANIKDECKAQIVEYLRQVKGFEGNDEAIVKAVLENKLNATSFSMFSGGDTGIKRCKFMLQELDKWNKGRLDDETILKNITHLYNNKNNPPKGLGNSIEFRMYIAKALFKSLGLTYSEDERAKEEKRLTTRVENMTESEIQNEVVYEYFIPSKDTVENSLIRKKVEEYINQSALELGNIKTKGNNS